MKQTDIGTLLRMTVLAVLLGSASYAQDATDAAPDDASVEQGIEDDVGTDDASSDEDWAEEDMPEEDWSDEDWSEDEGSDDPAEDDGSDVSEGDGGASDDDVIVIDDGLFVGGDPIEFCQGDVCITVLPMEIYPSVDGFPDDWVKRDDDTAEDCTDDLCFTDETTDETTVEAAVTDHPEILYSVTGGGPGQEAIGGEAPVLANVGAVAGAAVTGGQSSAGPIARSADAAGRVLCLSVPKAARNGRSAFDLCEP